VSRPLLSWTDKLLVTLFRFFRRWGNDAQFRTVYTSDDRVWPVYHRRPSVGSNGSDGVPVVFFHGFGNDGSTWLPFFSLLGDRREYAAPDLPGFGRHRLNQAEKTTPRWYRSVTAELLRELIVRWGQPPILVGKSMGGLIAGLVAGELPDLVRALVLIDPGGIETEQISPFWDAWRDGRNYLLPQTRKQWFEMKEILYHQPIRLPGFVRRHALRTIDENRQTYERVFSDLLEEGFDPLGSRLGRITCPVSVIWGAEDKVMDRSGVERIRAVLPNAEISIIPDCGHSPTREKPFEVQKTLLSVLSRYG
jgi:pimeloyl-ACP methyl ester carboxylesterase